MERQVGAAIDVKLASFANAIGPCKKYWREGKIAVQKVVDCLKQDKNNGGFDIGWMLYNGSVGKRTALRESDFDVLIFINDHRPPLDDCLIHFEDVLLRNHYRLNIENVHRSPRAIKFKLKNSGIDVDLLPAANFLEQNPIGLKQRERIVEQHRRALAFLQGEDDPEAMSPKLATSLIAYQRQFVLDLGEFNAQAVRLAKLWFKSLLIGKPPSEAKTMLELIMVACVMEQANNSHLSVFDRFISKVVALESDSVKIKFTEQNRKWSLDPPKSLAQGYVIDPCNPYNDYLKGTKKKSTFLANMIKAAKATRHRLQSTRPTPANILDIMFQPLYIPSGEFQLQNKDIVDMLCSREAGYTSRYPDMKVRRKEDKLSQPDYSMTLEAIKWCLLATISSSAFSPDNSQKTPADVVAEIKGKCEAMIGSQVLGKDLSWVPATRSFDTCDVVLTVPVPNPFPSATSNAGNDNLGAIKFGFSWAN